MSASVIDIRERLRIQPGTDAPRVAHIRLVRTEIPWRGRTQPEATGVTPPEAA